VNDILKQRLVGALILLALGVVFWPIIFVPQADRQVADQPPVPPPPVLAAEPIATPDAAGLQPSPPLEATVEADGMAIASAQDPAAESAGETTLAPTPTETAAAAHEPSARQAPPQPLRMDGDGVPIAWTLQVATVSSAEKADALRNKLLAMNQKAYVTQLSSGGKTLHRVSIGPKFERVELEKLQGSINAEFGVTTMVVRYIP
jgi:DedD protein